MKPPISDPFSPTRKPKKNRIFRADFSRYFVGYFISYLVLFIPTVLPALAPIRDDREILVFFGIVFGSSLISSGISLCYPVEISAENLIGFNFWGAKRQIGWPEIRSVRAKWFIFSYATISTLRKRNLIWVPLTLRDRKGFARAVEELAPDDNPLRLFLQKRGF